jgi:hypothetical protein
MLVGLLILFIVLAVVFGILSIAVHHLFLIGLLCSSCWATAASSLVAGHEGKRRGTSCCDW